MLKKLSEIKGITLLSKAEQRRLKGAYHIGCEEACETDNDCRQGVHGSCSSGVCIFKFCEFPT